jgi:hypothetical protein
MPAVAKICAICNADVSHQKRIKDPAGHYYCEPCYASRKGHHAEPAGAAPKVAPVNAAPANTPPPEDDGMIALADDLKPIEPVAAAAMFACADCKKLIPEKQVRNDDGEFICLSCFAKRRKGSPSAMPAKRKVAAAASAAVEEDENRETWADTLVGGMTISAGVLVLTFVVHLVIAMFFPPTGKNVIAPSLLVNIITAVIQTIFTAFNAAALIFSMIITARMLGGIDFGYIGAAIWKSIAVCLAFSVLYFFSMRNESLFMISLAFNSIFLLLAFIIVFKIDFFEAIILSAVNFLVFFGMAILMGILLVSVSRGLGRNMEVNDEREPPAIQQPAAPKEETEIELKPEVE